MLQVMNLIGDVKGKVAVMVDDMIDTAGKWNSLGLEFPEETCSSSWNESSSTCFPQWKLKLILSFAYSMLVSLSVC